MIIFIAIALALILYPIGNMIYYLVNHKVDDKKVLQMRSVLFALSISKFIFISGELFAALMALLQYRPDNRNLYILLLFGIPIGLVALVDWWALFKIRALIKE